MADKVGVLWDEEVAWDRENPFGDRESTAKNYEVYTRLAQEQNMELFIGRFDWYSDRHLSKAWYYDGEEWCKEKNIEINGVYDKFKFDNETIPLKKEIAGQVPVLNNYRLEKLCKDKYLTYKEFKKHLPETRLAYRDNISDMLDAYGRVIVKPRYDFGGRGIKVIEELGEVDFSDEEAEEFVVQAFIDSSNGIPSLDVKGMHDLRAVLVNGEVSKVYIRQPEEGYLSNLQQGGSVRYVDVEDYPEDAKAVVDAVRKRLEQFKPSIYSVDLIFDSNEKPYILELNSKPGIGFHKKGKKKQYEYPTMKQVIKALKQL